ncbi:MAG: radical SAM family heme chaperone HemW [Burkholderiales bacterium]
MLLSTPVPPDRIAFQVLPPLSLYVHIPWCVRKCPYCDFNSHASRGPLPEAEYVAALVTDLESALPGIWGRQVKTVFLGGGTPSLLSGAAVNDLLAAIRARVALTPDAEITLEANPGTFEAQKFADFRAAGVNRLSIGIQSFEDQHLRALGRVHDAAQARKAIEIALANFDNINLDLMYGLPGQTLEQALADIDAALAYAPSHVSAYHLTIEPNTAFYRAPPTLPADDLAADMQQAIEVRLGDAGYLHYETSAFARPGRQSRHNLNYWTFGDYLGIGAGAHGKLSYSDRVVRQMRRKHPRQYLDAAAEQGFVQEEKSVPAAELPFEFMMNALRLIDGVELQLFEERTSMSLLRVQKKLASAEASGLLERDHRRLRPTLRGQRFLNDLLQHFLD